MINQIICSKKISFKDLVELIAKRSEIELEKVSIMKSSVQLLGNSTFGLFDWNELTVSDQSAQLSITDYSVFIYKDSSQPTVSPSSVLKKYNEEKGLTIKVTKYTDSTQ